jgi:hypothetical protein
MIAPKQSEPNSKQATTSNIFKWQLCSPVAAVHRIPFAARHFFLQQETSGVAIQNGHTG